MTDLPPAARRLLDDVRTAGYRPEVCWINPDFFYIRVEVDGDSFTADWSRTASGWRFRGGDTGWDGHHRISLRELRTWVAPCCHRCGRVQSPRHRCP